MNENAEMPRAESGAFQEDSAVSGASAAIVAQVQRRREAASRCEPLECGHQDPLDCTIQCGAGASNDAPAAELADQVEAGDIVKLWADAKSLFFAKDFPPYASSEWQELHPDDPKRLAAALEAAEMWRLYGDDVTQWLRDATAPKPPLWQRRTRAELDAEWEGMKKRAAADWAARRAALNREAA